MRTRSELPIAGQPSSYSEFQADSRTAATATSSISIDVLADPIPPNRQPVLYDNNGFWYVQPEDDGYRLSLPSRDDGEASVAACSNADTTQVRVYVREDPSPEAGGKTLKWGAVEVLDWVLLMNHLAPRAGAVVHAAGVVSDGEGLVFAGVSTAGKSTLSRLLAEGGLSDSVLSDDRLVLRLSDDSSGQVRERMVWGAPWCGDANISHNRAAPLSALFFLVKAPAAKVVAIQPAEALRRLLPTVSSPWYDKEPGSQVLDTCSRMVESTSCYELHFRPDETVVDLLTSRRWG